MKKLRESQWYTDDNKSSNLPVPSDDDEEEYRKIMIKQKEEFEQYKERQGDSDLVFNRKDGRKKR